MNELKLEKKEEYAFVNIPALVATSILVDAEGTGICASGLKGPVKGCCVMKGC